MGGDILSVLILGGFAALFAIPITLAIRKTRRRTEQMRVAAAELGVMLLPKGDGQTLKDLASYQMFSQGDARTVRNMLWGKADGLEMKVFDYDYSVGSEESRDSNAQSVVYFRPPELDLPAFSLRPRSIFDRLASIFGYRDIAVVAHPTFSKTYLLRGQNEDAVQRLFDDAVLSHFERGGSLMLEGGGRQFVFFRSGKLVEPENVRFLVQEGFEILALFWKNSSRRRQELPHDFRHCFRVGVAGDVPAVPEGHPADIRQSLQ